VLGLALCLWLVAFATHIHADGDELSNEPSSACTFCLSLPGGAPAPSYAPASHLILVATTTVVEIAAVFVALDVPSFYLSRGPPAL
jgi:hypothetical protein